MIGNTNKGPKNNPIYIDSSGSFYKIFGDPINKKIYDRRKKINKILKRTYEKF
mgnify:CR=1 FL=1